MPVDASIRRTLGAETERSASLFSAARTGEERVRVQHNRKERNCFKVFSRIPFVTIVEEEPVHYAARKKKLSPCGKLSFETLIIVEKIVQKY